MVLYISERHLRISKNWEKSFLFGICSKQYPKFGPLLLLGWKYSQSWPGRLLPPNTASVSHPRSRDALHTICVPFAKMEKCHDLNHLGWWTPFSILKHIFYVFGKGRSFANIRGIHKHLMDWMSTSTTTACPLTCHHKIMHFVKYHNPPICDQDLA